MSDSLASIALLVEQWTSYLKAVGSMTTGGRFILIFNINLFACMDYIDELLSISYNTNSLLIKLFYIIF